MRNCLTISRWRVLNFIPPNDVAPSIIQQRLIRQYLHISSSFQILTSKSLWIPKHPANGGHLLPSVSGPSILPRRLWCNHAPRSQHPWQTSMKAVANTAEATKSQRLYSLMSQIYRWNKNQHRGQTDFNSKLQHPASFL